MKKVLFFLVAMLVMSIGTSAQTIVKGDMNDDGRVTVADITSVVDVAVGNTPMETLNIGSSNPYEVDNSYVVGTWYRSDGTSFTLNADGTTDWGSGYTYEFMPYQGSLFVMNESGKPIYMMTIRKITPAYLLVPNEINGSSFTYYTNSSYVVSGITLSQSSLTLLQQATAQLTATITPPNALNANVVWSSSDTNVATVDANGLVTAVAGGTCTITCAAADNAGASATCQITVLTKVSSITLQAIYSLYKNDVVQLQATVLPDYAYDKSVTWSSSDNNVAEVSSDGQLLAKDYGTCTVTCTANDGGGASATCTIYVKEDVMSYVDLGLPSGTLWATCNVGATSPEGYGDYFAWGETTAKSSYGWSTYRYGRAYAVTKYNQISSYGANGYTDDLTELELSDDAAYVNWGSDWRTPSVDQFNELVNSSYTTSTWTTLNGVNGQLITSKSNGNFIFLPAAGRYETQLYSRGENGYYWSRSLKPSSPNTAQLLFFTSSYSQINTYTRCFGVSVRPVRASH